MPTTTEQATLAEFLLARIAEDEAAARRYPENRWSGPGPAPLGWDPARVLAECEAKRRIVELHDRSHECSQYDHNGDIDNCTWVVGGDAEDFCSTVRLLALPYADHPDYRQEWRP